MTGIPGKRALAEADDNVAGDWGGPLDHQPPTSRANPTWPRGPSSTQPLPVPWSSPFFSKALSSLPPHHTWHVPPLHLWPLPSFLPVMPFPSPSPLPRTVVYRYTLQTLGSLKTFQHICKSKTTFITAQRYHLRLQSKSRQNCWCRSVDPGSGIERH